jgi:hypothetical protein
LTEPAIFHPATGGTTGGISRRIVITRTTAYASAPTAATTTRPQPTSKLSAPTIYTSVTDGVIRSDRGTTSSAGTNGYRFGWLQNSTRP